MGTENVVEVCPLPTVDIKTIFNAMRKVDMSDRTLKKDTGRTVLDYISWATALDELSKNYNVDFHFHYFDNDHDGIAESPYLDTPLGLMVETDVIVEGNKRVMQLAVMDSTNRSMRSTPYEVETKKGPITVPAATMTDINKASMRCLAKNIAAGFGLGLNLWTKEDIPDAIASQLKIATECKGLISQKFKAAKEAGDDKTADKITEICKTVLPPECNGDPSLCEDEDTLKELRRQLMGVRVSKKK